MARSTAAQLAARRALVLEYTIGGATTRQISQMLAERHDIHVTHAQVALDRKAALAEIAQRNAAGADELRAEIDARLRRMLNSRWNAAAAGDDDAQDRVMKIDAELRKMYGLDRRAEPDDGAGGRLIVEVVRTGIPKDGEGMPDGADAPDM